jgi:hypothetical protein
MCFWGEALVLGPNINLPMQEDAVATAFLCPTSTTSFLPRVTPV